MNILVIGNGFDLAHDLPTSYPDFLKFLHCIELTSTCHENRKSFLENHVDNIELHNYVREYIENAYNTRISNLYKNFTNSNTLIQEIYDNLEDNIWYRFLQYVYKSDKMKGINWIDFEHEIRLVIERIDKEQQNIYMPFQIDLSDSDEKMSNFSSMTSLFLKKYVEEKRKPEKYEATYNDFIEKSYLDLRRLVRCLEIYLTECVEKIPITKISQDIKNLDVHAVLNFNYTHTYANNYLNDPKTPIHYLHGEVRSSMDSKNNIVLGIDEYHDKFDRDIYTNYNIYKKFTQRIINETGFLYRDWIKNIDNNYQRYKNRIDNGYIDLSQIFIFGHSLDVTDKDVLKDLISRPSVRTTVFYYSKQQQATQIANLVKMLEQDTFIDMINCVPQRICFAHQRPMQNKI